MIQVTVYDKSAIDIINLVASVRDYGLKQGTDFNWAYYPESFPEKKKTVFTFYQEQHASFFALKWL